MSTINPTPIFFRRSKVASLLVLQKEYLPRITRWINDPDITKFLTIASPQTYEDEESWFNGLGDKKEHNIILGIGTAEGELIGTMGLHNISWIHRVATTGSLIGEKELHGKGYGTATKMLLLDYAFNVLNLRKINSMVFAFNERSKRALEKCGYHEEGRRREQLFVNGEYVDEIMMAVFRPDFTPLWEKFNVEKM